MSEIKAATIYFEKPGRHNSERVFELAKKRAEDLKISNVIVASTTGYCGSLAVKSFSNSEVIIVSHSAGYAGVNTQELTQENRLIIENGGGRILTTQHSFAGVNRAIRKKMDTYQLNEIIADVLRIFGPGMKVMFEIAMMTADAGLIEIGKPVIAIAGSHRGADTAAILYPEYSENFFKINLAEMICIPSIGHPLFK
jgi:hypothetical protein